MKEHTRKAIEEIWNTPLPADEFERRLAQARAELDGDELENLLSLIRWFRRRYPTPLSRWRYLSEKAKGKFAPAG